jgi:ribonuclease P protein component
MEPSFSRQFFRKEEKLCSKTAIEKLFNEGNSFYISPIKVLFLSTPTQTSEKVKILISVPKKYIRNAVDRNRIKRLLREAYRKNKYILQNWQHAQSEVSLAFIFTARQPIVYKEIETTVVKILQRLLLQEFPSEIKPDSGR